MAEKQKYPWWGWVISVFIFGLPVLIVFLALFGHGSPYALDGSAPQKPDAVLGQTNNWVENGTPIRADYVVRVDQSRSVRIKIDAAYRAFSSVREARGGKADILIKSDGKVTYENLSNDREVKGGDHELSVVLPRSACEMTTDFKESVGSIAPPGKRCVVEIININVNLDPGESVTKDLDQAAGVWRHKAFKEGYERAEVDQVTSGGFVRAVNTGIVVAGKSYADDLNRPCDLDGDGSDESVLWESKPGSVCPEP